MIKKVSFLVVITLVLMIFNSMAFAGIENLENDSLYISSTEIPSDVINYAQENFHHLITSVKNDLDFHKFSKVEIDKFMLGTPFNIYNYHDQSLEKSNVYYFPVLCNNKIKALLAVALIEENQYVANFSKYYAENLEKLKLKSSKQKPFRIVDIGKNIVAINDDYYEILESPKHSKVDIDGKDLEDIRKKIKLRKNSEDIFDLIKKITTTNTSNISYRSAGISNYLGVEPVLQGNHPWCGAACVAAIINYKTNESLTAECVTIEVHGSAIDEGITNSEAKTVFENHGLSATITSPLSFSQVVTEIDDDDPIFMQMQRTKSDGTKAYHGLVLRGYYRLYYHPYPMTYSIINPWYDSYVTITANSNGSNVTYITGSRTYTWYKTIKGF